MRNIHPRVCGVIPQHLLRRMAEQTLDPAAQSSARLTLDQMHELEVHPERTLLQAVASEPPPRFRKRRNIYDARQQWQLRGKLVMSDHKRSTDVHAVEAWQGLGATLDFMNDVLRRHSIDGRGMRLDATITALGSTTRSGPGTSWSSETVTAGSSTGSRRSTSSHTRRATG